MILLAVAVCPLRHVARAIAWDPRNEDAERVAERARAVACPHCGAMQFTVERVETAFLTMEQAFRHVAKLNGEVWRLKGIRVSGPRPAGG